MQAARLTFFMMTSDLPLYFFDHSTSSSFADLAQFNILLHSLLPIASMISISLPSSLFSTKSSPVDFSFPFPSPLYFELPLRALSRLNSFSIFLSTAFQSSSFFWTISPERSKTSDLIMLKPPSTRICTSLDLFLVAMIVSLRTR
jgi:hypothetical protein